MAFEDLIERLGLLRNDRRSPAESMREIAQIERVGARRYRQLAFRRVRGFQADLFDDGPPSMPLKAEFYWLQRWSSGPWPKSVPTGCRRGWPRKG